MSLGHSWSPEDETLRFRGDALAICGAAPTKLKNYWDFIF